MSSRTSAGRKIALFLGMFAVYIVAGHALKALPPVERGFVDPWTRANVRLAASLASPWADGASAHGTRLRATGTSDLDAREGCDGINALLILASTILAFPVGWRARLAGVAVGLVAIFVINAGRIASLLLVASRWPARLDFFHIDVWQPAMMLIAFALFFLWASVATRPTAPRAERGS